MDAVVIEASGPPAQSLAYRSVPTPEPGPGEVLVEVHAAAVNPLDIANAAGSLGTLLPMIPGGDFAGVVVSDGADTGREVWGSGPALGMALGAKRPGTRSRHDFQHHFGVCAGRAVCGLDRCRAWEDRMATTV